MKLISIGAKTVDVNFKICSTAQSLSYHRYGRGHQI